MNFCVSFQCDRFCIELCTRDVLWKPAHGRDNITSIVLHLIYENSSTTFLDIPNSTTFCTVFGSIPYYRAMNLSIVYEILGISDFSSTLSSRNFFKNYPFRKILDVLESYGSESFISGETVVIGYH